MAGKSVHGQSVTASHDHESSSDIEETESLITTSAIISSLFTQLDTLEKAQRESVEAIRSQQQHSDTLRRSIRDIERTLHQQHVARQKAKIKRLQKTATEAAEGVSATVKQGKPEKSITTADTAVDATVTSRLATISATTSAPKAASILGVKAASTSASTPPTTAAAPQALQDAQQDTTIAIDDDDADYYSVPPPPPLPAPVPAPAPVAPMTAEVPKATPKPLFSLIKQTPQSKNVTESASETSAAAKSKPSRPVQKMVPSRGRPTRARGVTRGRIAISSSSSSSSSSSGRGSPEAEEAPSPPKRGGTGIGTGRRSRPFKRGAGRISTSSVDEDEEPPQFTPILSSSRKSGFTAVNTPHTWVDYLEAENHSISSFPAGAGPASSTKKPIPPPRSQKNASAGANTPDEVALFTAKDLRGIFGGGNPGSICATVKSEDMARAIIKAPNYICLSPDAHFKPPGTMCDNAEMLDIYGQEDPIDRRWPTVPVFRKVNKLWMYCGQYKVGERRMVTVAEWREGNENVRKHWAKRVQDTEWGREWLVRKGWLVHGEIRNVSLNEILGYFEISDDKKGLRFCSTALHFQEYNNVSYNKMAGFASDNYPDGISLVQLSTLKANRLILPAPSQKTNNNQSKSPAPTPANKRRRQEGPAPTSVRTITTTSSAGRGARRTSRSVVDYRIAPMNEFTTEEGGKSMDDVVDLECEESDGGDNGEEDRSEEEGGEEDIMVIG